MPQDQDALLARLRQLARPASLSEINAALDVPERTLRRWLNRLIADGSVFATGEKKGRRYALAQPASLPVSTITSGAGQTAAQQTATFFSAESMALIERVRAPLFQRPPCSYRFEFLEGYQPNRNFYLNEMQRKQLARAGRRLSEEMPAGTYARKIFNRLLIDLSYHSSRLEGNTYSLVDTEKLVLEGQAAEGKLDAEKVMIINHKDAIKFLVDGINRMEVSVDNIRTLHYLLADGLVAPGDAGQVRRDGVRISSTTYMPLEGRERLETQLERVAKKAAVINDPFEQSFFLLVHIAYLQAFIDVNKRTSRLAANLPLVRHNLVPLSFSDICNDDYALAVIATYELNEVGPLAQLYVGSYLRSCDQYGAAAEAVGIDTLRVLYRPRRRALIAEIVVTHCCGSALPTLIQSRAETWIPAEHRSKFIEDVKFDLAGLAPFNIAGLGVTQQDLREWQALCDQEGLGF